MKRLTLLLILGAAFVPGAFAQSENEHVQVGVFADYLHLGATHQNLGGLGARAGFMAFKRLKLEAEMSYDFRRAFTEGFSDSTVTPPNFGTQRTNLRALTGLFGFRVNLGTHNIQPFVTAKGGFLNVHLDPRGASFSTFTSGVENLRANNVSGVFYPGAGLEGHIGPVGLRLEVGDEIYYAGEPHHNLRATFGPVIRF